MLMRKDKAKSSYEKSYLDSEAAELISPPDGVSVLYALVKLAGKITV